ncbi:MAG: cyclase family protein [Chloroflexota bacterium]|nr:cyclase family protein [Chloroflexota bacterium]
MTLNFGTSRVIDISVPLSPDLPVWPGDPEVRVEPMMRIAAGDVANVSGLTLSSHTGTHVDAPWHFIENGATLDDIPLERWIGPCVVMEVPPQARRVEPQHLDAANLPSGTQRLLLRTANSTLWQTGHREFREDYVALSPAAARWIVERGIRLVGIDYLSIEAFDDQEHATHRTLLGAGVLIVEGLSLSDVTPGHYTLLCLPLRLAAGDGAPARVLLVQGS